MDDASDEGHGVSLESGHHHVGVEDGGGDDHAGVHGPVPAVATFLLLPQKLLLAAGEGGVGEAGEGVVQLDHAGNDVVLLAAVTCLDPISRWRKEMRISAKNID